jgi:hypothetical protein
MRRVGNSHDQKSSSAIRCWYRAPCESRICGPEAHLRRRLDEPRSQCSVRSMATCDDGQRALPVKDVVPLAVYSISPGQDVLRLMRRQGGSPPMAMRRRRLRVRECRTGARTVSVQIVEDRSLAQKFVGLIVRSDSNPVAKVLSYVELAKLREGTRGVRASPVLTIAVLHLNYRRIPRPCEEPRPYHATKLSFVSTITVSQFTESVRRHHSTGEERVLQISPPPKMSSLYRAAHSKISQPGPSWGG